MGSSPVLALLLPMSAIFATVVYIATGNLVYSLLAFVADAIPIAFIYNLQLRKRRDIKSTAQDRLSRYSSLGDR